MVPAMPTDHRAVISVRVNTRLKDAIDRAAEADRRTTQALVEIILEEWAAKHGLIDPPAPPPWSGPERREGPPATALGPKRRRGDPSKGG